MNSPISVDQAKEFFQNKQVLVLGTQKSMRMTLKKILFSYGVDLKNIIFVDGGQQAAINELKIHNSPVIFSTYMIEEETILPIYRLHEELYPNRMEAAFFVLSDNNSLSSASVALDYDIDAFIAEPYTMYSISETIQESLRPKIVTTEFDIEFSKALAALKSNNSELANQISAKLTSLKGAKIEKSVYLQGLCALDEENYEQAIKYFKQSDDIRENWYRNLKNLAYAYDKAKKWPEAYEVQKRILEKFPLSPERIPDLIKLAVVNKKYDDIFFFYDFSQKIEIQDTVIKKHLAAGLAICGKFLLDGGKKKKGVEAIKLCAQLSDGSMEILKSIIPTLLKAGIFSCAKEIMVLYAEKWADNTDFKMLELEVLSQSAHMEKEALAYGFKLVRQGVERVELYSTVLTLSIKLKRNPSFIEELLGDAIRKFPESEPFFLDLKKNFKD